MKLGLINSAWAQAGEGTEHGIRLTREIGFDTIDIFADPLAIDARERRLIRTECRRNDLPVTSVACVALGLIDFNPSVRAFHVSRCKAYLDFAYELEAKNLLLVLGEYLWQREVIAPRDQWSFAVETVRTLGDHALELGLEIALELEPFQLSLLNDVSAMQNFLDDVGNPAVMANLDISHLALAKQPPELIRKLEGEVAHVHISDCDGKVHGDLPPGRGVVQFAGYLKEIARLGMDDRVIAIELEYSPEPDKIVAWVREAYEKTAELMREAGLRP